MLDIDLPEIGPCPARVVWRSDDFFGCRLRTPLPKAAMSAALLKSYLRPDQAVRDEGDHPGTGHDPDTFSIGQRFALILILALGAWAACLAVYMLVFS